MACTLLSDSSNLELNYIKFYNPDFDVPKFPRIFASVDF